MSVYRRGGVWWMDFSYRGRRVQQSTGQIDREAAEAVERQAKDRLRQEAHGVAIATKSLSQRFQDWAEVYYLEAAKKLSRPDRIDSLNRVALGFWGARPEDPAKHYPDAPYHDLRLNDPIDSPLWLEKWEQWLDAPKAGRPGPDGRPRPARVWSGQTKNQYRSLLSQFYALALQPAWRATTGIDRNPCVGIARSRGGRRIVTLDLDDVRAILSHASYHLRVAVAIALLTPKLRLGNILKLRFDEHFSPDLAWLTVAKHKTVEKTDKPLVAYVPEQLRTILRDAKARGAKRKPFVVQYRGAPVSEVRGAVRGAVERATAERPRLAYGRVDGITFHTLRHAAATTMAELRVSPDERQGVMGHEDIATTLWYTHLRPTHEIAPTETLSAALPIQDLVMASRIRAVGKTVAKVDPEPVETGTKRDTSARGATARKRG